MLFVQEFVRSLEFVPFLQLYYIDLHVTFVEIH